MKVLYILLISLTMGFLISCGQNNDADHSLEADATHLHEADEAHVHEADDAHIHESDTPHTDENSDGHTHAADEADIHEPVTESADEAHLHEEDEAVAASLAEGVDYTIVKLEKQDFRSVTRTSGQILVDIKDEIIITAKSSGIVRFNDHFLYPGLKITKGTQLFQINGEDLTENNSSVNFARVKADYDRAKINFDRASRLIGDRIITEAEYLEAKSQFEKTEAEYLVYKGGAGSNSSRVAATNTCFLNTLFVTEGEKVSSGDPLASVIIEHNMVLRADIPPSEFASINEIEEANFATSYNPTICNTGKLNGKKISAGKSSGENSYYIPVYFRMDYSQELIPGTFADVWLLGKTVEDVITIPNNSILEEYGKYYVYISHDDHFDKRFITPGKSDGESTLVISGLSAGETIVSDGAYQVKMSMMNSIPDAHNHNH